MKLQKNGTIYRANRLVNWSCKLNSAISDIEVEHIEIKGFTKEAIRGLHNYNWPGNIREIEHIVERAVIITDNNTILPEDLHFSSKKTTVNQENSLNLEETEKLLIQQALEKHHGVISRAAKDLGLTRAALYRRLEKHQL